jgi:hypothetical protein
MQVWHCDCICAVFQTPVRASDPDPSPGHPGHHGGPGPHRHRQDRQWQDHRLPPAHVPPCTRPAATGGKRWTCRYVKYRAEGMMHRDLMRQANKTYDQENNKKSQSNYIVTDQHPALWQINICKMSEGWVESAGCWSVTIEFDRDFLFSWSYVLFACLIKPLWLWVWLRRWWLTSAEPTEMTIYRHIPLWLCTRVSNRVIARTRAMVLPVCQPVSRCLACVETVLCVHVQLTPCLVHACLWIVYFRIVV